MCHGAEFAKSDVALPCTQLESLSDELAAFVIATVWKTLADIFQRDFHVGNCPVIQLRHGLDPTTR